MNYSFANRHFTETEHSPEKLAVAGSDRDIDWATLQRESLQLAKLFRSLNIPNGHSVILYGHKEAFYPLAMLACFHANVTYIPIDTIYPDDRVRKIISLSNAQVLINCSGTEVDFGVPVTIDQRMAVHMTGVPDFSGPLHTDADDPLQYMIFTSGSTGEPKGVRITHSSVMAYLDWAGNAYGFGENDRFMNQAPFTFDVSLCDVLNAFHHGGTLVLNAADVIKDQDAFLDRLIHYRCTVWTSTPSFAYLFLRHERFRSTEIPDLKTFLFMGEELPNRSCGIIRKSFPSARILNAYGPTEATIVTTLIEITDEVLAQWPTLPIGYPMKGSQLLIEKADPQDKEGELIIVGDHVSIGYFRNDALNAGKFFIHEGKRAFRTGDLAYYEGDLLFCIGRNDDQVKMNGFRIELNEISAVLCRHETITDAVTVALKRGNEVKKLVSFVISPQNDHLQETLLPYLEKTVPYYMIPGAIVPVATFPYSASHKIDKKQLIADYLQQQFG
jgi:D-alanine--poly(phosphoribitol) ligase subunit 1